MGFGPLGFRGDKTNTVTVNGASDAQFALVRLPNLVYTRYLPQAMRKAVQPLLAQLVANTPAGPTGNLRAAAASRVLPYRNGTVFGIVGYKRAVSERTADNKGFHSHLIEFGTAERRPRRAPFLSSYGIRDWRPPGWSGPWPMVAKFVRGARALHPLGNAYMATNGRCVSILTDQMTEALARATRDAAGGGA
jgi:hypothetical protein